MLRSASAHLADRRWVGCCVLGLGLILFLIGAAADAARAGERNPFGDSIASAFLQSRAQIRIFRHDDKENLDCQSKNFVDAQVVSRPEVVDESLNERKWIERWVLNRCGDHVTYDVYFTEVGDGGAIFTFRQLDWSNWQARRAAMQ